jgi:hypothetical protein
MAGARGPSINKAIIGGLLPNKSVPRELISRGAARAGLPHNSQMAEERESVIYKGRLWVIIPPRLWQSSETKLSLHLAARQNSQTL